MPRVQITDAAEFLRQIARIEETGDRFTLKDSELSIEVQRALLSHPDPLVRVHLANGRHVATAILEALAADPDADVRHRIAMRARVTPRIAAALALDPSAWVRGAIAADRRMPSWAAARLAADPDEDIRIAAAQARRDPAPAPFWSIHAYAIVCEAGCIADASGGLPPALMNDADWAYFQAELDRADLCILGRTSHKATPNLKRRRRVVMSGSAHGLSREDELTWAWNPGAVPRAEMLARVAPEGGRIAIPGGSGPFTLFLDRIEAFHLSRKAGIALAGGTPCFSAPGAPEAVLQGAGFLPGPEQAMDPEDGVTLTIWTRTGDIS